MNYGSNEMRFGSLCQEHHIPSRRHEVLTAVDGEEALRRVAEDKPPLVLLDIILPKRNGYQVLRELKSGDRSKGPKVILVSSKNQESDQHWGLKQGADDYVTKPFQEKTLLDAVTRHLGAA